MRDRVRWVKDSLFGGISEEFGDSIGSAGSRGTSRRLDGSSAVVPVCLERLAMSTISGTFSLNS